MKVAEKIKDWRRRYRAWRHHPFTYNFKSEEPQHCVNCGHDFTGNFCPYCSQKVGTGPVTWSSVRQGVMEVWGVGNRSMSYSIWQLLWRPGYFISDYINGRRQVSFPPVKMLLILAVIITMGEHLFGVASESKMPEIQRDYDIMPLLLHWMGENIGWALLIFSSLFILPTWILFRFSPRTPRHTIPAGFFLQVFMCVIILVVTTLEYIFGDWVDILLIVYYVVVYRQLFGYRLWATLWRLLLMLIIGIMIAAFFVYTIEHVVREGILLHNPVALKSSIILLFLLLIIVVVHVFGYVISWWRYRRREKKEAVSVSS